MNYQIINILNSNERFELYYGNGETIEASKDNFSLDYDGWITITNNKVIEYIKIDSIYKIISFPEKKYVYADIPEPKEMEKQILNILSNGEEYQTRDIKRILVENAISDKITGEKLTKNELKNKIEWKSSFLISELKKSKLIESKHHGCLNITNEGLEKLNGEN